MRKSMGNNKKMTADEQMAFEDCLRKIEGELEAIGSQICDVPESLESWSAINKAIECVRRGIHTAYKMRDWSSK